MLVKVKGRGYNAASSAWVPFEETVEAESVQHGFAKVASSFSAAQYKSGEIIQEDNNKEESKVTPQTEAEVSNHTQTSTISPASTAEPLKKSTGFPVKAGSGGGS